ncbi:HTH luxR-type domain-containing protein [Candidatus Magnetomoraceae bacterium gMMP-15]
MGFIIAYAGLPKSEEKYMSEYLIHIVGPNQLQNELLASHLEKNLEKKINISFMSGEGLDTDLIDDESADRIHTILVDCFGIDPYSLFTVFEIRSCLNNNKCHVAFFNIKTDKKLEKKALDKAVKGIFYGCDPNIITKGIRVILNGELWFSRKTLTEYILKPKFSAKEQITHSKLSKEAAQSLTRREKEILIQIASGSKNNEIATKLSISPHTVKTHVYNIFKKLNISNRLQATFWVTTYLKES